MFSTHPRLILSQVFLRSGSDSGPEDRALDRLVERIEGVHDCLNPAVVDLHEEILDGLLSGRSSRIVCARRGVSGAAHRGHGGGRGTRIVRIGRCEEEEFDISSSKKARDVVVVEAVDMLEVPARVPVSLHCWKQDSTMTARPWKHEHVHLASSPLHFFDNIQTAMHDELVHMARIVPEARDAVAATSRCAKFMFE